MIEDRERLETLFVAQGFEDFRWISPDEVVVAHWVRMKCKYGCDGFGRLASCPPNTLSVAECRQFFDEYDTSVLFHFQKQVDNPENRHAWTNEVNEQLLALEHEVFFDNYPKAFLLFMGTCRFCSRCKGQREECKRPEESRPTLEGMAVDVFSTVRRQGYPIEVLTDYDQMMNRYGLLLVE